MRRYEFLSLKEKTIVYDRLTKKLVTQISSSNKKAVFYNGKNESIPFQLAIYPNQLFKKIMIPKIIIIILNIIIICCFIASSFCMAYNIETIFPLNSIFPNIYFMPILIIFSIIFHEFAHAIVGASLGGVIAEIGMQKKPVRYKTIIFWNNSQPFNTILFYFAGIASNMLLVSIGIILFLLIHHTIFLLVIIINSIFVILNSVPVKHLNNDGRKIIINFL